MTIRTGRPSRLPKTLADDPRLDRTQNISTAQEEQAQRHRLNTGMMKDGTEPMEAPLPLQSLAFADFPDPADWEGSHLYDTTNNVSRYSNGVAWLIAVNSGTAQAFTGDVTGSGTLGSSIALTIANDAVTFAKMQNISNSRLIGRNTAGTGNPEEVTIEQALNWISGSANGDLMYRTGGNWARLAIGTASQELRVNSGATAPEWYTPTAPAVVKLTPSGVGAVSNGTTNLDLALDSGYEMIEITISNIQPATDATSLQVRFSQSGSFVTTNVYSYGAQGGTAQSEAAGVSAITTAFAQGNSSEELAAYTFRIFRPSATGVLKQLIWYGGLLTQVPDGVGSNGYGQMGGGLTGAIDAVRFFWSSGNWASGWVSMRGYV